MSANIELFYDSLTIIAYVYRRLQRIALCQTLWKVVSAPASLWSALFSASSSSPLVPAPVPPSKVALRHSVRTTPRVRLWTDTDTGVGAEVSRGFGGEGKKRMCNRSHSDLD